MCRYAFSAYKPHYVCFDCRKMFRRRLLKDIDRDKENSIEAKCPQCGGLMADMGLDFKPPRKTDIKAWQNVKDLYNVGITFHSCGCSGPGYIPKDREEIIKRLSDTRISYINNLRFWLNFELPDTKQEIEKFKQRNFQSVAGGLPNSLYQEYRKNKLKKEDAVQYWTNRLTDIDKNIASLQ